MKRLFIIGLMFGPVLLAQRKEDILSIQRDVAALQDQVRQLQHSQDEKMAALQTMLQQAVDAATHTTSGLTALEHDVDSKLNDQQTKLVAPVVTLGTKVDQMADDLRSVSTNVADLVRRMGALNSKLDDISNAIRTITAPPPTPAPAAAGSTTTPQTAAQVPPMSSDLMYQNAFRDYQGGKLDLAMAEFNDVVKYYPDSSFAADAQYYIGYMYYRADQYDDAVKAFEVCDNFPENPRKPEALYYKALSLLKLDRKTDAGAAFRDFIKRYPHSEHIEMAHKNLQMLGLEHRKKRP